MMRGRQVALFQRHIGLDGLEFGIVGLCIGVVTLIVLEGLRMGRLRIGMLRGVGRVVVALKVLRGRNEVVC